MRHSKRVFLISALSGMACMLSSPSALPQASQGKEGNSRQQVFESHVDRPFHGERACKCGGAGAPCPDCNRIDPADPDDVPAMPKGFVPDIS